jgi:uncharacterized protein
MLNYEIERSTLAPYVPRGTEIDSFEGRTFVSMVGFRFKNTKLLGRMSIPFHANFEEVNLRFYVRREDRGVLKRGVVFIAEIVPRQAIAFLARLAYNENYICAPLVWGLWMSTANRKVSYRWDLEGHSYFLGATTHGESSLPREGSVEQFITEHYWGFAKQRDGGTVEYRVEHEPWRVSSAVASQFSGDTGALYGDRFKNLTNSKPHSALVADGSPVKVFSGRRIAD